MHNIRSDRDPVQRSGDISADLQGDLSIMSIHDLLAWIELREKSGVLTLVKGRQKKQLLLLRGRLVNLVSNRQEESFDYQLVESGVLSRQELTCVQQESHRSGIDLLRYLQMKKILCAQSQEQILKDRICVALSDLLAWESGRFSFAPGLVPVDRENTTELPISTALQQIQGLVVRGDATGRSPVQQPLLEQIRRRLQGGDFDIPPAPKTLQQIQRIMAAPNGSVHDVLKIIMADQVLTSRILKVVNSSFYSFSNPVTSVQHAIVLIGFKPLLGIVTAHSLPGGNGAGQQDLARVMLHSFKCAYAAKWIAGAIGEDEEIAFVCGLLHDIGKTVLYTMLREYNLDPEAKEEILGAHHTRAGVLLAEHWNLPEQVMEVIKCHHDPAKASTGHRMVEVVALAHRLVVGEPVQNFEGLTFGAALAGMDLARFAEELQRVEGFVGPLF